MASSSTTAPRVAPASDLETGKEAIPATEEEGLGAWDSSFYAVVYGVSLFTLIVGTWAFLFPFTTGTFVGAVMGSSGLVIGVFIVINGEVFVSYLRLFREDYRLKDDDERFRASLGRQKKAIEHLKETQKAMETFDEKCGGMFDAIEGELEGMIINARDSTRRNIDLLLLIQRPSSLDIKAGKELDNIIQVFSNIYVRVFCKVRVCDKFAARLEEMKKGFQASPRWKRVGSMSENRLKFILTGVLFEALEDVKEWVRSHVEAGTDEMAASLSFRAQPSTQPKDKGGEKAPVPKKEEWNGDWTEAETFVGLKE